MRRLFGLGLAAILTIGACSDDPAETSDVRVDASTTSGPSTTALADVPPPAPAVDVIEIDAEPPRRTPAGPITWVIEFTNTSEEPVTITFPSGQPGDAVVLDSDDTVVHRWSDGRFFDQAVRDLTLAPGQTERVELPDDLSAVEPGFYELRLELAVVSPPEAFEQNLRVTKPES